MNRIEEEKYLTEYIFQYLDRSTSAYNVGSLSNQDRAKYIMDMVCGTAETISARPTIENKVFGKVVRKENDRKWNHNTTTLRLLRQSGITATSSQLQ